MGSLHIDELSPLDRSRLHGLIEPVTTTRNGATILKLLKEFRTQLLETGAAADRAA